MTSNVLEDCTPLYVRRLSLYYLTSAINYKIPGAATPRDFFTLYMKMKLFIVTIFYFLW